MAQLPYSVDPARRFMLSHCDSRSRTLALGVESGHDAEGLRGRAFSTETSSNQVGDTT
jgi:hypothetical protein